MCAHKLHDDIIFRQHLDADMHWERCVQVGTRQSRDVRHAVCHIVLPARLPACDERIGLRDTQTFPRDKCYPRTPNWPPPMVTRT